MTALLLAALFTSTAQVGALAAQGNTLWVATGGGVEQYDLAAGSRARVWNTGDGLDSNSVSGVRVAEGRVHARTARMDCVLEGRRFHCSPAPPLAPPEPRIARSFHGARETARLTVAGKTVIGTAGQGVWIDGRKLTPEGQLCANHVEALAEFQGRLWVGTFDSGLCVLEGGVFRSLASPFRMVNDLHATPRGLYVAAAEGLFVTTDGRRFRREPRVRERGVNRLATSAHWLFVTTPATLYAVRLDGPDVVRRWRHPAGSTALQSVAVSGKNVWLASEDAGVVRMRNEKFEAFDRASGLPTSWTVDVAPAPEGGVWAATLRNGAVHLDGEGNLREQLEPLAWGLRLYQDQGTMRFATQQGLADTEALPDPRVHALLRTGEGLWIGTEGGLLLQEARPPPGAPAGEGRGPRSAPRPSAAPARSPARRAPSAARRAAPPRTPAG